jgi:hypothetical protein
MTMTPSPLDAMRARYRQPWCKPRKRKPSVRAMISEAKKADAKVTVAPDGSVSLQFGEAKTEANGGTNINPWDKVLIDVADKKRPT